MIALVDRYRVSADPLRTERRVELVLVGLGVLLLLALLYQGLRIALADEVAAVAPAPDSVRVAALARPSVPEAAARQTIVRRPLFWAERTPRDAPAVAAEAIAANGAAAPRMKEVTVSGIYGSGESGGVILTIKDRELRLAVGDEVQGWRLARVTGDSAMFTSGDARDERELLPRVIEAAAQAPADTGAAREAAPEARAPQVEKAEDQLTTGGIR